jgi:hypothetical protein
VLQDVEYADDVRVAQARRCPRFPERALAEDVPFGVVELVRPDSLLDGHIAVEELISGYPYHTHAATADHAPEAVPTGEQIARLSRNHSPCATPFLLT